MNDITVRVNRSAASIPLDPEEQVIINRHRLNRILAKQKSGVPMSPAEMAYGLALASKLDLSGSWAQTEAAGNIRSFAPWAVGVALALVALVFVRILGFDAFVIAAYVGLPYWLGMKFGSWYSKKNNPNMKLVGYICWGNVVSWVLPPLGGFTAGATFEFNLVNTGARAKYNVLATTGIALAIANLLFGALLNII